MPRQTDLRYPPPHVLGFGLNGDTAPRLQHRSRYQVVTRVTTRDFSLCDAPAIADHVLRAVKPHPNIGLRLFDRCRRQPADLSHNTNERVGYRRGGSALPGVQTMSPADGVG